LNKTKHWINLLRSARWLAAVALLLALAPLASAGLALAANVPVSMANYQFHPQVIFVRPGDTVTWTTTGQNEEPHTVTADDLSYDSGDLAIGQPYSHQFNTAGVFPYFCKNHGSPGSGMSGTVVVANHLVYLPLVIR